MSSVKVQLFGAFRKYGSALEVPLTAPCSVAALKKILATYVDGELLNESAFGTADEIFQDHAIITPGQTIALLPPVCGG